MTRDRRPPGPLTRLVVVGGGLVFVASLTGFIVSLQMGRLAADAGPWSAAAAWPAALADTALFLGFGLHHSVFARSGIKAWLATVVPASLERTAYVWVSSVLFALVYLLWQPVPGRLWSFDALARAAAMALQAIGVLVSLRAAGHIDVLDLAGVRQGLGLRAAAPSVLMTGGLYRLVRHPIYFGWLLIVWPAGEMTGTRAVFAALSTLYLVVAIPLEERGLVETFGARYDRYRSAVRWRLVPGVY